MAEGLTAAGAAGAWDDATGGLAGGVDVADLSDGAGDLAIPGIGSAIRIVSSGLRRRQAIRDVTTRKEAGLRVAQDAAEGVGLVVLLGEAGFALGLVADMFGAMGLGSMVGRAAGAGLGGYISGRRARSRDKGYLAVSRDSAVAAIARYGQEADKWSANARGRWTLAIGDAEARLEVVLEQRRGELAVVLSNATSELASSLDLRTVEAEQLIAFAGRSLRSVARTGWSPTALRNRRYWLRQARRLQSSPIRETRDVLLLVVAAPDGVCKVEAWLKAATDRRAVVIAAVESALSNVVSQSVLDRHSVLAELSSTHSRLLDEMAAGLQPWLDDVEESAKELQRQIKIAGVH